MKYENINNNSNNLHLYQHNILMSGGQLISGHYQIKGVRGFVFQLINTNEEKWTSNNFYDNLNSICQENEKSIAVTTISTNMSSDYAYTAGLLQWDTTTSTYVLNVGSNRFILDTLEIGINVVFDSVIQIL